MNQRPADPDPQALRYARDLARLHRLQRDYERLVPEALDPAHPEPFPAVVRNASVLFTDLRGFTALGERFADDPERLLGVVNSHLTAAVGAIFRCGGVVEKFVGDGILATFGARSETADHEERAAAAALGVVGANERLNRRYSADWGFRLEVGVGVAAGKLVIGRIGSPERAELGVLGDPLNVAARLVEAARPGEVLLAANVYHALAGRVRAELLGSSAVRGRHGQIHVYRIALGERGA